MTGIMKRLWGFLLIVALISQPMGVGEIDDYVSHPGNIPDFHNFSTPQLEPGQEGDFSLDVHNRYGYSLDNVVIIAEIYHRADIDESESLDQISSKFQNATILTRFFYHVEQMDSLKIKN